MQMYNRIVKKVGCYVLMLLYCACSTEPDRNIEEFQKDKGTVAQLGTVLKELGAADSLHLKQENEKGQLVDPNIRKSSSTEDITAKPNDVYAPYEFGGTCTDEKGASFHIEQTKQSGLMAQVNIANAGPLPQGFNTIRQDKQTFEQTLENAALGDYVHICETNNDQLHTCKVGELTVIFKTDAGGYLIYHKSNKDQAMRIYTNIRKKEIHFINKIWSMCHKEALQLQIGRKAVNIRE